MTTTTTSASDQGTSLIAYAVRVGMSLVAAFVKPEQVGLSHPEANGNSRP